MYHKTFVNNGSCFSTFINQLEKTKKYAKWKATYINQCLKSGETPQPGPLDDGLQPGMGPSFLFAKWVEFPHDPGGEMIPSHVFQPGPLDDGQQPGMGLSFC